MLIPISEGFAMLIIGAIIAAIATLLGVIISGVINYVVSKNQFNREKDWQRKQFVREKLETICQIIEEIDDWHRKLWSEALMFIQYGKKLEIGIKKIPTDRLSMLINFYAPALKPFLELISEEILSFGKALIIIINIDESGETKRQAIADLTITQESIRKICEAMTLASADLARKLA
jgi:hypothetical protein